jgi:Na+-transporting NADH:ubiquinone oxidoreductase subunit NqrD
MAETTVKVSAVVSVAVALVTALTFYFVSYSNLRADLVCTQVQLDVFRQYNDRQMTRIEDKLGALEKQLSRLAELFMKERKCYDK